MSLLFITIMVIVAAFAFLSVFIFYTVDQQTYAIIERFGKFVRFAVPGLHMKLPLIEVIRGRLSLRIQQLEVLVETKTLDNVFVKVMVAVQFFVIQDKIYDAFYKLTDPKEQITAFVFDVVRARVPSIGLDDVFAKKDEIAIAVKNELSEMMSAFGYGILKALVTDIDPDEKVKASMNEINAAQRMRVAANERGEAEKILRVKAAEAEKESMALQGKGVSEQRMAIIEGLKASLIEFQKGMPEASALDAMSLVLITQYFDALKEIGASSKTNTILLPHSPGGLDDIISQIRESIMTGHLATGQK
jgi:regulator of protease activity HflC (stomatin/prohibitin superfamily)